MCVAIIIDDKKEDSDKKKASSTSSSSNGGAATTTTAVTAKKEKKIAKAEEEPLGENVFGIEEDESDSKVAGAQKTKLCVCMYVQYIVSLSQSKLVVMMQLIVRLKRRLFEEIEPSSKHVVASHFTVSTFAWVVLVRGFTS